MLVIYRRELDAYKHEVDNSILSTEVEIIKTNGAG